jgi:hypothetical protein
MKKIRKRKKGENMANQTQTNKPTTPEKSPLGTPVPAPVVKPSVRKKPKGR